MQNLVIFSVVLVVGGAIRIMPLPQTEVYNVSVVRTKAGEIRVLYPPRVHSHSI